MSTHSINLAIRFLLELTALFGSGYWGWKMHSGLLAYILMLLVPVVMATIWGVFAVRGDPSRSGKTVIPTPGLIRLVIEIIWFGFAIWAVYDTHQHTFSLIFLTICVLHYIISYDRIVWMLKR